MLIAAPNRGSSITKMGSQETNQTHFHFLFGNLVTPLFPYKRKRIIMNFVRKKSRVFFSFSLLYLLCSSSFHSNARTLVTSYGLWQCPLGEFPTMIYSMFSSTIFKTTALAGRCGTVRRSSGGTNWTLTLLNSTISFRPPHRHPGNWTRPALWGCRPTFYASTKVSWMVLLIVSSLLGNVHIALMGYKRNRTT